MSRKAKFNRVEMSLSDFSHNTHSNQSGNFQGDRALGSKAVDNHFRGISAASSAARQQVALDRKTDWWDGALLRLAFQESAVGVLFFDSSGVITEANEAFFDLLGYCQPDLDPGELRLESVTAPECRQLDERALQQLRRDGFCPAYEKEYVCKDGSRVTLLTEVFQVVSGVPTMGAIILNLSSAKTGSSFPITQISVAKIWVDRRGRIQRANRQATDLLGYRLEELLSASLFDLDNSLDRRLWRSLWELSRRGGPITRHSHYTRPHSSPLLVEVRAWYMEEDEELLQLSLLDADREQNLERLLLNAQRVDSLGALALSVAHDLGNVLPPIQVAAEKLHQNIHDEQCQHLLAMMLLHVQRGTAMIRQLLDRGREAGKRSLLDLGVLVAQTVSFLRDLFPPDIEILYTDLNGQGLVEVDQIQLQQVLINLCLNAKDAMPHGGCLKIESTTYFDVKDGTYVVLKITDNGCGMTPEERAKAFEPFYTTKPKGVGTGLGLSAADRIIRAHGGFIEVASRKGLGTVFSIYLPLSKSASSKLTT